ncbi:hypothetical protein PHYBOEH_004802 [Phytophthora boehmeriae]|uniref:Tubulin/FtsZ GTPase domain-containing protein n=1 Tax=Phytophthora boehmeriae TaxID=109152 RepID=A0A8T1WLC5_9STRA|nr:hypothetical protein PHYBOEH_004802 [Phytophthora boehmeriae]
MLTLQVGQCGNQLGRALFDKLAAEEDPAAPESAFFRLSHALYNDRSVVREPTARRARAVLVDMEPKVIQQCYRASKSNRNAANKWEYEPNNSFMRQSGSGNNWALGYKTQAESELLDLLQTVRPSTLYVATN